MPDSPPELPPGLPLLERLVVAMAHPDDEVLWASAVLARAERIVLAFGPAGVRPQLAEGRRRAMAAFPLAGAVHLDLPEADVFAAAAWPEPEEVPEGLAIPGEAGARYRANHGRLVERLAPLLEGAANVVTHAPWGEYGHEEHVQVFRAVLALRPRLGFRVWVPGYCSDVTVALMRRHLGRLGEPTPFLPTDPALGDRLKRLYQEHGCWTWFDDYAWPEREVFYPYLPEGPDAPPKGRVHPVNHVWRGALPPAPPSPLARAARRLRRGAGRLLGKG